MWTLFRLQQPVVAQNLSDGEQQMWIHGLYLQYKLVLAPLMFLVLRGYDVQQRERRFSFIIALHILLLNGGIGYFLNFLLRAYFVLVTE
jgi:hypothetical protein